ncbi:helix-turn-helix transcriptional regulator [Paenibacillus beijingensis]|uniref:DNA-binding protein n=1 Tax=Paenibacillus beijingensis TaxID=1126833 RepID=A0A0D5NEP5_9BACL|nr:helix-turn-helix transcriptional regulator [Paenibacillus beijingensis]AJY73452.1 DNA-binding protein [Paenibacillus beijingensis]
MNDPERRHALGHFLRKRRESLTPYDVGLPSGVRRRTPGLRREEVAQLANVGTSWYIWLEQGRDVQPSAQVLESVALALRLTPNERRHLFLLARQSLPPQSSPPEEKVGSVLRQVLDDLEPTPAYVLGRRWDFLSWNQAADEVFFISRPAPPHDRNMIWRIFTDPEARTCFRDWEQIAKAVIAEFHIALTRYAGNASFEALFEDLKRASSEFCRLWPLYEAPRSLGGHKRMDHPTLGFLEFQHVTLQAPDDPDVRVMIYTPTADTRAKLEKRLETISLSSERAGLVRIP